ncbi:SDE2 family protein [Megaselia abdita]
MPHLLFNNKIVQEILPNESFEEISNYAETILGESNFYLTSQGKKVSSENYDGNENLQICPRLLGGKGGFGSMLRAIGAQIEKTTNREACRDLSGRRLRDINEEKRIKEWAEKQKDLEEERKEKKQKKLEKMMTAPKHEFKDEEYEKSRQTLLETVSDSVEAGFRNAKASTSKRKIEDTKGAIPMKKKALWIDEGFSSCSSDSDSDDEEEGAKAKAVN